MPPTPLLRLALVTVSFALVPFASAAAQGAPEPGGTLETATGPVAEGQTYGGSLDEIGEKALFRVDVDSAPVGLSIAVAQTNNACELWARLLDSNGNERLTQFIPHAGSARVYSLLLVAETQYLELSSGPYVNCSGATYKFMLTFQPLAPAPGALTRIASPIACGAACEKARLLGNRVAALKDRVRHAHGARRHRLRARLARVRHRYRLALRQSDRFCRTRRFRPA